MRVHPRSLKETNRGSGEDGDREPRQEVQDQGCSDKGLVALLKFPVLSQAAAFTTHLQEVSLGFEGISQRAATCP